VLGRVLGVAPSCYTWLKQSRSNRAQEDARLLRLIRASFVASQSIYGAPRVFLDLREAGETCSKHRVARLMREHRLHALHGYRTRRWSVALPDALQDQEKDMIEAALAKGKGRVAGPRGAAAKLGIPRSTLESKIKQLKLERSRFTSAS
jgi:putative transposase